MNTIHLQPFVYGGVERIGIIHKGEAFLEWEVRKLKGIRWSRLHNL